MRLKKLYGLVALALCGSLSAHARFELPNFIKRYHMGFSYSIATANYKSTESVTDPNNSAKVYTNTIEKTVTSKLGYGGLAGLYIPVKRLGENALLAVGIDYMYNAYMWNFDVPMYNGWKTDVNGNNTVPNYSKSFGFTGMSIGMGLPVSADFKFGGEASIDKNSGWTGTIGAGAYPAFSMTVDAGGGGWGKSVTPFVKGEIGYKAGIVFKLRAMYTMGKMPFYTENTSFFGNITGLKSNSELIGKNALTFSLIIMPFSWNWQAGGWWNTYH